MKRCIKCNRTFEDEVVRCPYCHLLLKPNEIPEKECLIPTENAKKENEKECKHCNKTFKNDVKYCPHCGRKLTIIGGENHAQKKLYVIAIVCLIAMLIGVSITYFIYCNNQAKDYRETLLAKDAEITEQRDIIDSYDSELDYLMKNAVYVTETGECYHKACCQYVKGRSFYIYNSENARVKGYRKCSVCFAKDYDWREHID